MWSNCEAVEYEVVNPLKLEAVIQANEDEE